jgi:uncharacterized protein (TIGR02246 family)
MTHRILTMAAIAITSSYMATAADESPSRSTAPAAAKAVAVAFVDDWNRHDMKSFANLFVEDADFVNVIGLWWHGRAEIHKAHEAIHATRMKNSKLVAIETAVRVVRPDVAVVHVRWQLSGDTGIDGVSLPLREGILSFVTVSTGGQWLVSSAQNTDIVPVPNVPPAK